MTVDFSPLAACGIVDFYLLRHGKSEGNKMDIVQGREDYALSAEGRDQAVKTGRRLASKGIRAVRCSPLRRASETAALAAAEAGLPPPLPLPELMEMDTGIFTGLTLEAARKKYPPIWESFQRKSWDAVEGSESSRALSQRAFSAWDNLIHDAAALAEEAAGSAAADEEAAPAAQNADAAPAADPARTGILVVSHAGFLQWLIKTVTGGQSWFPLFPMSHCGLYHLSVDRTIIRWESLNVQAEGVTGKR